MKSTRRSGPGIALWISIAWGLLPLTYFLPVGAIPPFLEHTLFVLCFPGWMLAMFFCGGVHGEFMDAAPVLCAVFSALISFFAISLATRWLRREKR